ncbi:MAG: hypothetical protein S4CHLAM45_08900 [Chlamydiales bacterium]|nr:hypothetical protein [Chlamydiales bacterium]MCH9620558.1 hypothetical protein [Chlamydiales bacterium]MCH9622994.1 hypothetical protein [Chlamydiales bacterium]
MSFQKIRDVQIEELKCQLVEIVHKPTGARIMHIANDDDENFFNLSFQTLPDSSNGVAHILEHTVLCGSTRFPMRDPFFGMTRRSLNTFMNAFTGADFTCYPAASQVPKDFYNLLDVYLDAVFQPRLLEKSFLQEGHRLEFSTLDDPSSPLEYKGVVFNEMKGALATGDARLNEFLMETLCPDITYGVNSGGDPKVIPQLSYEELKAFHAKYYHPSRCLYFFYGNLPLEKHLSFLEEKVLGKAERADPIPQIPKQPRFKKPRNIVDTYPLSEDPKDKTLIGMGWLTCNILDQVELLALNVIDMVLMGTDAGPLKRALLESKLCHQADTSLDNEMSEIPYFIVCRGCPDEAEKGLEKIVRETLETIVDNGLKPHLVDGAIHQLELSRTEIASGGAPFGLALYFRAALLVQHGGNAEDGLRVHTLFKTLREKVADQTYLPTLIQKHLLDNPHFIRVILHPDLKKSQKELKEEQTTLAKIKKKLSSTEVTQIVEQAKGLEEMQEEEDNSLLPKVTLKDIQKKGREFSLNREEMGPYSLYSHNCFTNGLIYADLIFDLPKIREEDLPYLRLFVLLLPQMGCGGRSYIENLNYVLQHIGAAGLSLELFPQADDPTVIKPALTVRGKALARKADKLFPLLRDMMVSTDFRDPSRIGELLMQHYYGVENSIQTSSLRYALNLAASGLSIPSKISNAWYGLDYYWKLKEIVQDFEKNPTPFIDKLEQMQKLCLGLEGGDLIVSCDDSSLKQLKKETFFGLLETPQHPFQKWESSFSLPSVSSQGRITASPVAFTAFLFPSVSYTHVDAPALNIASEIMENKILHKRIREQGGAYGSGAANSVMSGQFYFYAFRDPHLASTKAAFADAISFLKEGLFDEQDIEEAKLGLFQELDSPTTPGMRALSAYSRLRGGRPPKLRQQFRERLLTVDKKQIISATEKHLVSGFEKGNLVSFASKEFLEKENSLFKEGALPLYSV